MGIGRLFVGFNTWSVLFRLALAVIAGGLIGLERGRHGRAAGLRTHILICMGACATALTGIYLNVVLGFSDDVSRLSAQVISGIGFLGAGTILIRNRSVITGLTTAAGMWTTAVIGIAIGCGFYEGALIATVFIIVSMTILIRLEKRTKIISNIYVELGDINDVERVVNIIHKNKENLYNYDVVPPKSGKDGNVGVTFVLGGDNDLDQLDKELRESGNVVMIIYNSGI